MKLHGLLTVALKLPYVLSNRVTLGSLVSKSAVLKRSFSVLNSVNCQQWGKNKKHRDVKLKLYFDSMADPQIEEVLAPLRASVKEQVIFRLETCVMYVSKIEEYTIGLQTNYFRNNDSCNC